MKRFWLLSIFFLIIAYADISEAKAQFVVRYGPAYRPAPRRVWERGHWRWDSYAGQYAWDEGHWVRMRRGGAWVDGHWQDFKRGGSRWVPGHWR